MLSSQPLKIIAHRGASGMLPEHTLAGYQLALEQGADIIEPDLIASSDGVLFCRHDLGLARSTDIASRANFAHRVREGDWPCFAFDAAELDSLRAIQPFADRDQGHNGRYPPPRFADAIDWAAAQAATRGRNVMLYPEIKHPVELAARGVDPVFSFIEATRRVPVGVEIAVQCFDVAALRRIHESIGSRCCLLVDSHTDPWKVLSEHSAWIWSIGLSKKWLFCDEGARIVEQAHDSGVEIHAWTFRDDQIGPGFPTIEDELTAAMDRGADALFCDYPATAIELRKQLGARIGRVF